MATLGYERLGDCPEMLLWLVAVLWTEINWGSAGSRGYKMVSDAASRTLQHKKRKSALIIIQALAKMELFILGAREKTICTINTLSVLNLV